MSIEKQPQKSFDCSKTIYEEVRRAYEIRNTNLNSQQQRILSVLTTNGLVFAFLGASASVFMDSHVQRIVSIFYVFSMFCLVAGIVAALLALRPKIPPTEEYLFLNPTNIQNQGNSLSEAQPLLDNLTQSILDDVKAADHMKVLRQRRIFIYVQLAFISLGVLSLLAALICLLVFPRLP